MVCMMEGHSMRFVTNPLTWLMSRYRVRLLLRAAGRAREAVRYALVQPQRRNHFHIVSAQRNMGSDAIRCLQSVYDQSYPKDFVRHIFFDDASTDATPDLVRGWLTDHPNHSVQFIQNTERQGMLSNNLTGFQEADPSNIGIELNGDDWLPDPGVLRFLNRVYDDDNVWMTYNTLRQTDGTIIFQLPPSRAVRRNRSYRQEPWATSHLHTFRIDLYRLVPLGLLTDPSTGELWVLSQDLAVYLSMLEMAGDHARHIFRITCTYHPHAASDHIRDQTAQLEAADRIRSLPPCRPLPALCKDDAEIG